MMKLVVNDVEHEISEKNIAENIFEVVPYGPAIMAPRHIPSVRTSMANAYGVQFNYLITATGGGLGDTICAEPTVRYFLDEFKDRFPDQVKVSVLTRFSDLFRHLAPRLEKIFEVGKCQPIDERQYNVLATAVSDKDFRWEFLNMGFMHCLDAPSMCSMGRQLPVSYRELMLVANEDEKEKIHHLLNDHDEDERLVVIHPGRTWPSRTLPADYWDDVISGLIRSGIFPVLIGAQCENGNSTVEVNANGCLDLREKLSLMETTYLLQRANVVLTNDSAPLHMAASGDAWIGFFGTARHPDFITYQRRGIFGHKMQNLATGGMYAHMDLRPGLMESSRYDKIEEEILRSWLPEPSSVVNWVSNKL